MHTGTPVSTQHHNFGQQSLQNNDKQALLEQGTLENVP